MIGIKVKGDNNKITGNKVGNAKIVVEGDGNFVSDKVIMTDEILKEIRMELDLDEDLDLNYLRLVLKNIPRYSDQYII